MKVAIWDTYVKSNAGTILHFDIIVPEEIKQPATIFNYGQEYLASQNKSPEGLSAEECRFCHMEAPSEEIVHAIKAQGYYILEMEPIPAELPEHAGRSAKIGYIRGHFPEYRFKSFSDISEAQLNEILNGKQS